MNRCFEKHPFYKHTHATFQITRKSTECKESRETQLYSTHCLKAYAPAVNFDVCDKVKKHQKSLIKPYKVIRRESGHTDCRANDNKICPELFRLRIKFGKAKTRAHRRRNIKTASL